MTRCIYSSGAFHGQADVGRRDAGGSDPSMSRFRLDMKGIVRRADVVVTALLSA